MSRSVTPRVLIVLLVLIIVGFVLLRFSGPDRNQAIQEAIQNVNETMDVSLPDVPHPTPYTTGGGGGCEWVPELPSSKETLRYQVEVALPPGDNGRDRQDRAIKHWIERGAKLRKLPYSSGPSAEVKYHSGFILAFAAPTRGREQDTQAPFTFYIVATTPCVPR